MIVSVKHNLFIH